MSQIVAFPYLPWTDKESSRPALSNYEVSQIQIIKYMGNKRALLGWLLPIISENLSWGDTILDLFAGTSSVGYALKPKAKVITNDLQAVLHNKAKPKKINNDWPYAALLKCSCGCGASIIFETKRKYYKKTDRWAEYTYARSSKRCSKCVQKGIDLAELERQLDEKIAPVTIDEETWRLGIKLLNAKYESEAKQRAQVVESRQRQYQRIQSELDGYFKMRAREEMSADEFTVKKKAIFEEQARLKEKIDDGINGQRTWLELAEDFFTTAYQAREMLNSDDLEAKRKAVAKIGWNVLLKDEKLVWTYQKPYDILLKPQYRSDLRCAFEKIRTDFAQNL